MAVIGCLGELIFTVSADVVQTLKNMQWSGSARYTKHNRHLNHALTEFTGLDPDQISFDITFSVYLGVDPMTELVRLWNYERNAVALSLVVGNKEYGKYRWTIENHKIKMETFDTKGDITGATVNVKLLEYYPY